MLQLVVVVGNFCQCSELVNHWWVLCCHVACTPYRSTNCTVVTTPNNFSCKPGVISWKMTRKSPAFLPSLFFQWQLILHCSAAFISLSLPPQVKPPLCHGNQKVFVHLSKTTGTHPTLKPRQNSHTWSKTTGCTAARERRSKWLEKNILHVIIKNFTFDQIWYLGNKVFLSLNVADPTDDPFILHTADQYT